MEEQFLGSDQQAVVNTAAMRKQLNHLRLQMLKYCRYLMPQRECLEQLVASAAAQQSIFSKEAVETIEGAKSNHDALTLRLKTMSYQAQVLQQELASLGQERLSANMYVGPSARPYLT